MMRVLRIGILISIVVLAAGIALVQAQDTPATGATCDSDLILDLYIAERYLGYNDFRNQLSASGMDTSTMSDPSTFNYGQYQPLFDSYRNMSSTTSQSVGSAEATADPNMQAGVTYNQPGGAWDPNFTAGVTSAYAFDDATFDTNWQSFWPEGTDTSTITPLAQSTVAGETAECTQLRQELNRFHRSLAFSDLSNINIRTGQTQG